jgi:signal transduction histidine kinase
MAQTKAAFGLFDAVGLSATRKLGTLLGNVRVVVIASVVLISGSFASAAIIQMRLDREHALAQAATLDILRAQSLAAELSSSLDRYAAIGQAFAGASLDAESTAALAEAGGAAMRNVAVLDSAGHLISEMKSAPHGLLPLSPGILAQAQAGAFIGPSADGRSFVMLLPANRRIVAIEVDPHVFLSPLPDALIAMPSGRLLALGRNWDAVPDVSALALTDDAAAARIVEFPRDARLVSLARLSGWPLVAGSSVDVGRALDAWHGTLPLYLFIIIGPALAGAGLAAIFVREVERRMRAAKAVRALRSTRPEEARLLVRLADAERRAMHAERAKADFMAHMSHELRTPLNAIIGFAEVIETSLFGATGHPKYVEYARDIGRAGRQLHGRVGEILDFVDLDARKHEIATTSVDLSRLARECLLAIQPEARHRGVRLLAALPKDVRALADDSAVRRIFASVLANAVQFTPKGGDVRMAVKRDKDFVLVTIRDTGLGFSEPEKEMAGESFRRFSRPGHSTGLGLGLAVATTLARRLGGTLRISSTQGEGTTVELRLPADTAQG